MTTESTIFADNNSTTAVDPWVLEEMLPYFSSQFGNTSSSHWYGWDAEGAIEDARRKVAECVGADIDEIFFTSGATESNCWALRCLGGGQVSRIVTSPLEHKSVLENIETECCHLSVEDDGRVNTDELSSMIVRDKTLTSLMMVNNEIHTILDLVPIVEQCRQSGSLFHSDATQAIGRVAVNVRELGLDAMSFSAHKVYGPKGIGALYVRRDVQCQLTPMIRGGAQERSLRAGTVPVPLVVGFGAACEKASQNLVFEADRLNSLATLFLTKLSNSGASFQVIGPSEPNLRQPGSLCLRLRGLEADKLCERLPNVAVSQGSACNSQGPSSHVLKALGISDSASREIIRLSFGRFNDEDHACYIASRLAELAAREISHH